MTLFEINLKAAMQQSIVMTELHHAQAALRLRDILLALLVFFELLSPSVLMLAEPTSLYHIVAWATPYPLTLAVTFAVVALSTIPYVLMQCFCPLYVHRRAVARWTCYALCLASLLWLYLSWESRAMNLMPAAGVFLQNSLGALVFSLALALTLNTELVRIWLEPNE